MPTRQQANNYTKDDKDHIPITKLNKFARYFISLDYTYMICISNNSQSKIALRLQNIISILSIKSWTRWHSHNVLGSVARHTQQAADAGPAEIWILMWSLKKPNKELVSKQYEGELHYTAKYEAYLLISNYPTKVTVKLKMAYNTQRDSLYRTKRFQLMAWDPTSNKPDNLEHSFNGLCPNWFQANT